MNIIENFNELDQLEQKAPNSIPGKLITYLKKNDETDSEFNPEDYSFDGIVKQKKNIEIHCIAIAVFFKRLQIAKALYKNLISSLPLSKTSPITKIDLEDLIKQACASKQYEVIRDFISKNENNEFIYQGFEKLNKTPVPAFKHIALNADITTIRLYYETFYQDLKKTRTSCSNALVAITAHCIAHEKFDKAMEIICAFTNYDFIWDLLRNSAPAFVQHFWAHIQKPETYRIQLFRKAFQLKNSFPTDNLKEYFWDRSNQADSQDFSSYLKRLSNYNSWLNLNITTQDILAHVQTASESSDIMVSLNIDLLKHLGINADKNVLVKIYTDTFRNTIVGNLSITTLKSLIETFNDIENIAFSEEQQQDINIAIFGNPTLFLEFFKTNHDSRKKSICDRNFKTEILSQESTHFNLDTPEGRQQLICVALQEQKLLGDVSFNGTKSDCYSFLCSIIDVTKNSDNIQCLKKEIALVLFQYIINNIERISSYFNPPENEISLDLLVKAWYLSSNDKRNTITERLKTNKSISDICSTLFTASINCRSVTKFKAITALLNSLDNKHLAGLEKELLRKKQISKFCTLITDYPEKIKKINIASYTLLSQQDLKKFLETLKPQHYYLLNERALQDLVCAFALYTKQDSVLANTQIKEIFKARKNHLSTDFFRYLAHPTRNWHQMVSLETFKIMITHKNFQHYLKKNNFEALIEFYHLLSADCQIVLTKNITIYGLSLEQLFSAQGKALAEQLKQSANLTLIEQITHIRNQQSNSLRIFFTHTLPDFTQNPQSFIETYFDFTNWQKEAIKLLCYTQRNEAHRLDSYDNPDSSYAGGDSIVGMASQHFNAIIAKHQVEIFAQEPGNTENEKLCQIESRIRKHLLKLIKKEMTSPEQDHIVIFIEQNRDALVKTENTELMEQARSHFSSVESSVQTAWRSLDANAPTLHWPNLFSNIKERETGGATDFIYSTPAASGSININKNDAKIFIRKMLCFSFLEYERLTQASMQNDCSEAEKKIIKNITDNYSTLLVSQLEEIRRTHNTLTQAAHMDSPSCYPGTISRLIKLYAYFKDLTLPLRPLEQVQEIIKKHITTNATIALNDGKTQQEKRVLIDAVISFNASNAQDLIVNPKNTDLENAHLTIRTKFMTDYLKFANENDALDFIKNKLLSDYKINYNDLSASCQQDILMYLNAALVDLCYNGTGSELSKIYLQYLDAPEKAETDAKQEKTAISNPFILSEQEKLFLSQHNRQNQIERKQKQEKCWDDVYKILARCKISTEKELVTNIVLDFEADALQHLQQFEYSCNFEAMRLELLNLKNVFINADNTASIAGPSGTTPMIVPQYKKSLGKHARTEVQENQPSESNRATQAQLTEQLQLHKRRKKNGKQPATNMNTSQQPKL